MDTKPAKSKTGRAASDASGHGTRTQDPSARSASARIPGRFLLTDDVLTLLVVITVVGAWLRLSGLANQSLWLDELWTWHKANYARLSDVLIKGLYHDVHPPLYFILHYYLQKYVGDSETVLRLPSAIAGVLTIPVIFLLGRRLYSDKEGLIAAALMAVLWCPVSYSQEARANMMMVLFTMLSMVFWIPLVESLCRKERPTLGTIIGFATCTLVASTVHYFGLYLVGLAGLGAAVVLLIKQPRALLALPLFYLPVVLAYIPWVENMQSGAKFSGFGRFYFGKLPLITWIQWAFNTGREESWWAAFALYAWLLARTVYDAVRKRADPAARRVRSRPSSASGSPVSVGAGLFLVLWLVVPFVGTHVQDLLWRPLLTMRNMMICLPAAYLLAARAITRIPVRGVYHAAIGGVVFILLLAQLLFGIRYYSTPAKDQYREAVAHIVVNDAKYPNSLIIGWKDALYDYYFERLGSRRRTNIGISRSADALALADVIAKYKPEYIWVIHCHWALDDEFEAFMKSRYSLIEQKSYIGDRGGGVLLFRNEPPRR